MRINRLLKKIVLMSCLVGSSYLGIIGYKYYVRSTYLPVRYPFLSANAFRYASDYHFDQPVKAKIILTGKSFDPAQVKDGDIIFIKSGAYYLDRFFRDIHPHIKAQYAILTHNGDETVPGAYAQHLQDAKLIAWFGCNVGDVDHPKMVSIPIGIMGILNKSLPRNCEEVWGKILIDCDKGRIQKDKLVYLNVNVKTNPVERGRAVEAFKEKGFCVTTFNRPYEAYLREMATFKFVVSPHGAGFDCYRTWEALMLGCIPIVKKSCLDCLYEGLPVLIVDQWEDITEKFLEQKYVEMSQQRYQLEKLQIDYWVKMIHERVKQALV